jgi:hypothetical protein
MLLVNQQYSGDNEVEKLALEFFKQTKREISVINI